MDLAGIEAMSLAKALLDWFGGASSETQALLAYHERWNSRGLPVYQRTVTLARDLRQLDQG